MTLEINFSNNLTFKEIHDLIMETKPTKIDFVESHDDVDLNYMFYIAHLLNNYLPEMGLVYNCSFRNNYPIDELSAEFALRDIPFEEMFIGDNYYNLIDERV